jgi:ATP-dependent protease ClpP protease subunit
MSKIFLVLLSFLSFVVPASAREKGVSINPDRTIAVVGPITGRTSFLMIDVLSAYAAASKEPVDIIFDSPGGDLLTGYLVVDRMESLRRQGIKLRCFVRTIAASMAFQMMLHCDERYATPHAVVLWHPVRVFWMGPLTATDANIIGTQLASANEGILDDLRTHLNMPEEQLMWHYTQETLHQAASLAKLAPDFFAYVGYNIVNLYDTEDEAAVTKQPATEEDDSADNTIKPGTIVYLHERFMP